MTPSTLAGYYEPWGYDDLLSTDDPWGYGYYDEGLIYDPYSNDASLPGFDSLLGCYPRQQEPACIYPRQSANPCSYRPQRPCIPLCYPTRKRYQTSVPCCRPQQPCIPYCYPTRQRNPCYESCNPCYRPQQPCIPYCYPTRQRNPCFRPQKPCIPYCYPTKQSVPSYQTYDPYTCKPRRRYSCYDPCGSPY